MIVKVCFVVLLFATTVLAQTEVALGEFEFADPDTQDQSFDEALYGETESAPRESPDARYVEILANRTFGASSGIEVSLAVNYFTSAIWYPNYQTCCPSCQNFQCGTNYYRLPCFYYKGGWCCPIRPYYISNCNCSQCVKQCSAPQCFRLGTCARRYRTTIVYAVCYSGEWNYCTAFKWWLPSSCYCNASCS